MAVPPGVRGFGEADGSGIAAVEGDDASRPAVSVVLEARVCGPAHGWHADASAHRICGGERRAVRRRRRLCGVFCTSSAVTSMLSNT